MDDIRFDALKQQSQHEDAEVRLEAVKTLLASDLFSGEGHENVDWELLERWTLDPDERIRDATILFLELHKFDDEGLHWLIPVLSEALGRYASSQAGMQLSSLANDDDHCFDLT